LRILSPKRIEKLTTSLSILHVALATQGGGMDGHWAQAPITPNHPSGLSREIVGDYVEE
jgi:hypothetical protein